VRLCDGNFTERLTLELEEDEGEPEVSFSDCSGQRLGAVGPDWQGKLQVRVVNEAGTLEPWMPRPENTNGQAATKKEG